jgi:predicted nuclease with TOPRIM domain
MNNNADVPMKPIDQMSMLEVNDLVILTRDQMRKDCAEIFSNYEEMRTNLKSMHVSLSKLEAARKAKQQQRAPINVSQ